MKTTCTDTGELANGGQCGVNVLAHVAIFGAQQIVAFGDGALPLVLRLFGLGGVSETNRIDMHASVSRINKPGLKNAWKHEEQGSGQ